MDSKDRILHTARVFLKDLPPGAEITVGVSFGVRPVQTKTTSRYAESQIFEKVFRKENRKERTETDSSVSDASRPRKDKKKAKAVSCTSKSLSSSALNQRIYPTGSECSEYTETELLFPPATLIPKDKAEAYRARIKKDQDKQRRAKQAAWTTESESEVSSEKKEVDKKKKKKKVSKLNKTVTESSHVSDFCEPTERLFPKCEYIRKEDDGDGKNYENIM